MCCLTLIRGYRFRKYSFIKESLSVFDLFTIMLFQRDRLEKALREKSKQADQLRELAQTFDVRINRMRQEVQDASDKVIPSFSHDLLLRSTCCNKEISDW